MFFSAVLCLAAAILAALIGFSHAVTSSGSVVAQQVFLAAMTAFVLTALRVVLDPALLR